MPRHLTPEERKLHYIKLDQEKREYPKLEPEELDPEIFRIPANYDSWKPISRGLQDAGEDIGERLTDDPSYIDRI